MLQYNQFHDLIDRQQEMNTIINPDWMKEREVFDFQVAMTVEANELIEHCDYKWWKSGTVEIEQAQMEVVDCWFFYLSAVILGDDVNRVEEDLINLSAYDVIDFDSNAAIEASMDFINVVSSKVLFETMHVTYRLWALTRAVGLSVDQLYSLYMGKLILNIFRQNHGYKDGTYRKIWDGLEDNEVLRKLMLRTNDPDQLDAMLELYYKNTEGL